MIDAETLADILALWEGIAFGALFVALLWVLFRPTPKKHPALRKLVPVDVRYYARRGEIVTCTNGHAIVTFRRDVEVGEQFDREAFVNWRIPEPKVGTHPLCGCGAEFWREGQVFHFHPAGASGAVVWRVVVEE